VDKASTSATEDGTVANPYKTIQAAINARPAAASALEAAQGCTIKVASGSYEEHLTVAGAGLVYIEAQGIVLLGDLATPRNVTYTPITGAFGESNGLHLTGIYSLLGAMSISAAGGVQVGVELDRCIFVSMDGSGITTSGTATLTTKASSISGTAAFNGAVAAESCAIGNLYSEDLVSQRCTFGGLESTVWTSGAHDIVTTYAYVTTLGTLDGCSIGTTLTLVGVGTRISASTFGGLVTFAADAPAVYSSTFAASITVVDTTAVFLGCTIAGTFTGPVSSYRVDGSTNSLSSGVSLAGGATLALVDEAASSSGGVDSLPFTFDNATAQLASLYISPYDSALGTGAWIILTDGAHDVYVQTVNFGGSEPTAILYDTQGLPVNMGLFSNVITLNRAASTLDILPHWEKMEFEFDMALGSKLVVGTTLYLEHIAATHNLINGRAVASVGIEPGCAQFDAVTIEGVPFTAVNPGPANPALQEFLDVASSGSSEATAASLVAAVLDPTSAMLIVMAGGAAVFAAQPPSSPSMVMLDSFGVNITVTENTGGANLIARVWDDIPSAVVCVPGSDLS
jgi:hypothetical protein